MDYKVELKPFKEEEDAKYKIIEITDITYHTSQKQPTRAPGKKVKKAFEKNEPGRLYIPLAPLPAPNSNGIYTTEEKAIIVGSLKKDPEFLKMVEEENKKGYKILLKFPETGITILAGADTKEFLQSKNGQRVLRGLAKDKPIS